MLPPAPEGGSPGVGVSPSVGPSRAEPGRAAGCAPPAPLLLGYLQTKLAALPGPQPPSACLVPHMLPCPKERPAGLPRLHRLQLNPRLRPDRVTGRRGEPICSAHTGGAAGGHLRLQLGQEARGPPLLPQAAPSPSGSTPPRAGVATLILSSRPADHRSSELNFVFHASRADPLSSRSSCFFRLSQVYRDLSRQEEGVPAHITRPRRLPPMALLTPLPLPQPPPHFPLLFPSFPTSLSPLHRLTDPPRHSMESREGGYQRSAAHFRQKPQCFREAQRKGKVGRVRALEQLLHLYPLDVLVSFQQGIFSAPCLANFKPSSPKSAPKP